MISACLVTSASCTTRLIASATISPSRQMTQENGSSRRRTAAADSSTQRRIIFKSIADRSIAPQPPDTQGAILTEKYCDATAATLGSRTHEF